MRYIGSYVCTSPACAPWPTLNATVTDDGSDTLKMFPGVPGKISKDRNTITFTNGVVWRRAANGTATLELTGPADVWFGVGFGAVSASGGGTGDESTGLTMKGTPWAVVVLPPPPGADDHHPASSAAAPSVEERKLGDHSPGSVL